jgi:hypothetical protein
MVHGFRTNFCFFVCGECCQKEKQEWESTTNEQAFTNVVTSHHFLGSNRSRSDEATLSGLDQVVLILMQIYEERVGWQDSLEGHVRFVLPLAPTVSLDMLAQHADPCLNPLIACFKWAAANLILNQSKEIQADSMKQFENRGPKEKPQLVKGGLVGQFLTQGQVNIEIWQEFPPYAVFQPHNLCLSSCLSPLCFAVCLV